MNNVLNLVMGDRRTKVRGIATALDISSERVDRKRSVDTQTQVQDQRIVQTLSCQRRVCTKKGEDHFPNRESYGDYFFGIVKE